MMWQWHVVCREPDGTMRLTRVDAATPEAARVKAKRATHAEPARVIRLGRAD